MSDTYGPMSQQPFAYYDPESSSWRTSQVTLVWEWGTYSEILPRCGSMRDGRLYEHPMPGHPIGASGYSSLLGTPQARDGKGAPSNGYNRGSIYDSLNLVNSTECAPGAGRSGELLLPTPVTADMQARHGNGNGHGPSLAIEAQSMPASSLGRYQAACDRWAAVIGRPPPDPATAGSGGKHRLNPGFVEWMMGLPEGHVTGHGLPRTQELKALGNGVVPQQAALALAILEA